MRVVALFDYEVCSLPCSWLSPFLLLFCARAGTERNRINVGEGHAVQTTDTGAQETKRQTTLTLTLPLTRIN